MYVLETRSVARNRKTDATIYVGSKKIATARWLGEGEPVQVVR